MSNDSFRSVTRDCRPYFYCGLARPRNIMPDSNNFFEAMAIKISNLQNIIFAPKLHIYDIYDPHSQFTFQEAKLMLYCSSCT